MKIVDGPINKDGRATYYNVDLHEMRRGSRLEQIGLTAAPAIRHTIYEPPIPYIRM
jgi:hypothetical protein